jgi:hypothetical protein
MLAGTGQDIRNSASDSVSADGPTSFTPDLRLIDT